MASFRCPNHKLERVDWEYVCKECGATTDEPVLVVEWRSVVPRDHISYKPREYVDKKLEKLTGILPMEFFDSVTGEGDFVDDRANVRAALRRCGTWREVYKALVKMNRVRDYLKVSHMMGFGPRVPAWVQRTCMDVVYGPYKLQLLYVLYKLHQLHGLDPSVVPLRCVGGTLDKSDGEWKRVCWDMGLPLQPTPRVLKTPWV